MTPAARLYRDDISTDPMDWFAFSHNDTRPESCGPTHSQGVATVPRKKSSTTVCPKCGGWKFYKNSQCWGCRYPPPEKVLAQRSRPAEGGCIEWTGPFDARGYGTMSFHGRPCGAHRVAFILEHGPLPASTFVCHRCDNPKCVNLEHLYAGDQASNMADMVARDRSPRGERSGLARLTAANVLEIRRRFADGATRLILAEEFGICRGHAESIIARRSWRHLK